jgi:DNA-binding MarR family transcriptional regulator
MALLMDIGLEGTTNSQLAKKAKVTKQTMNKVVKNLKESGYISSSKNLADGRSEMLQLTNKGKKRW